MAEKLRSLLLVGLILAVGGFLGSMVDQWTSEEEKLPESTVAIPNLPHPDLGRVQVEVLNAGGVAGMASRATDHLRESGFDVVYYGSKFFLFTVIYSYVDSLGIFTKEDVMIFLIVAFIADTFYMFFFSANVFHLNYLMVKGESA